MSDAILLTTTSTAIENALNAQEGGFSLQGKFIGLGTTKYEIQTDANGLATTNQLQAPVEWVEILFAKRVSDNQWQMTIDAAGTNNNVPYELSEVALSSADDIATANDHVIAIYSHPAQSIITVSPQVNHAQVGINMLLTAVPADVTIEIVHQDLPQGLYYTSELASVFSAIGALTNQSLIDAQRYLELKQEINEMKGVAA